MAVNLVDVPRDGWRFFVEGTGVMIKGGTINQLKYMVANHLKANKLPVPHNLDEIVEDTACRNHGDWSHWCGPYRAPANPQPRSKWNASEVKRFLTTVKTWATQTGCSFVPQAEAERRAAICATCPMNVPVSGCMGCTGVAGLIKLLRRDRRTSSDDKLNFCDVCGCALQVKVHLPLDAVDNSGLEYPPHCWQNTP